MTRKRPKAAKKRRAGEGEGGCGALGIAAPLLAWYREHRRRLPWRDRPTPYRVWVSEVMLQQTRVETVIPYFRRFLARFPTITSLAAAPLDDVLACWSGLGYYRRARSLHAGARAVVERHDGAFPADREAALDLPGVGPYTAGAILSIAFNLPEPVVDGNVERVLSRLLRLRDNPRAGPTARWLRELARSEIPAGEAASFNQALMELGALVCTPAAPACSACPLAGTCRAQAHGDMHRYPALPPSRAPEHVALDAAVVLSGDRFLLERVESGPFLRGLWLFPLATAQPATGDPAARLPGEALSRHLALVLGLDAVCSGPLGAIRHAITFRRLRIDVFGYRLAGPAPPAPPRCRWARLDELGTTVPVSSIVTKIVGCMDGPVPFTSSSSPPRRPPPARCR